MKSKIIALLVGMSIGLSVSFMGCAGYQFGDITEKNPVVVKTSVQLGVIEYLKYNPTRTDRLIQIVSQVKADVETGKYVTVTAAKQAVLNLVDFDKLVPAEKVLVMNLADALEVEANRFITLNIGSDAAEAIVSQKTRNTLIVVLQWIIDSANLMKGQVA